MQSPCSLVCDHDISKLSPPQEPPSSSPCRTLRYYDGPHFGFGFLHPSLSDVVLYLAGGSRKWECTASNTMRSTSPERWCSHSRRNLHSFRNLCEERGLEGPRPPPLISRNPKAVNFCKGVGVQQVPDPRLADLTQWNCTAESSDFGPQKLKPTVVLCCSACFLNTALPSEI